MTLEPTSSNNNEWNWQHMGIYLNYVLGEPDGLRSRFLADIAPFAAYYGELNATYPGDYPPEHVAKVLDFSARGAAALIAATASEADLIDRVVDEYWDYIGNNLLYQDKSINEFSLKLDYYPTELSEFLPERSELAETFYQSLFRGSSLAVFAGHEYRSDDGLFYLSWMLPAEVAAFHKELAPYAAQFNCATDSARVLFLYQVFDALCTALRHNTALITYIA